MPFRFLAASVGVLFSSSAATAQQSGLLLGIETEGPSLYRTLWIAPQNGATRVLANGPDLVAPRSDGFWRVCVVGGYEVAEGRLTEWDSLIAAPAQPRRGACATKPEAPSEPEQQQASCHEKTALAIRFVGSDAVSVEEHTESDCGAHYGEATSSLLRSLDDRQPIDLEARLEPAQQRTLLDAAMAEGGREFEDFGDVDTSEAVEQDSVIVPRLRLLHDWGIERAAGRWTTVGHMSCSPYVACGSGLRTFSVRSYRVPSTITGHDSLAVGFGTIQQAVPSLRDAVSSPRGDLLVAITDDSLFAFNPTQTGLGRPVLRMPLRARIVMAQWATGRFVARWTAQVRPLLSSR